MPKLNQMFPSKWLTAADLNDQDCTFTITGISQETVGQGDESDVKWVVYFHEMAKGLVLNKTNGTSLASCLGDDTDDWIGRKVVLYPTQVQFSGKMVDAIRIKERATKALQKTVKPAIRQPAVQASTDTDDGDDVPF